MGTRCASAEVPAAEEPALRAGRPAGPADAPAPGSPPPEDELAAEATCAICRDLFVSPFVLGCSHTFCGDCLHSWLARKAQCPNCRAAVAAPPLPNRGLDNIARVLAARGAGASPGARQERLAAWRAVEAAVQREWERGLRHEGEQRKEAPPQPAVAGHEGRVQQSGELRSAQPGASQRPRPAQPRGQRAAAGAGRGRGGVAARRLLAAARGRGGGGGGGAGRSGRRLGPAWQIPMDALFPPH
jgi:hypothetical protein